jgi:hypothetical protein
LTWASTSLFPWRQSMVQWKWHHHQLTIIEVVSPMTRTFHCWSLCWTWSLSPHLTSSTSTAPPGLPSHQTLYCPSGPYSRPLPSPSSTTDTNQWRRGIWGWSNTRQWMRYNCLKYLVKWKEYSDAHNSWQVHHQFYARVKVVKFHHKNPGAAHHINTAIFDSIPFTQADIATSWRSSCVVTLYLWRGGDVREHLSISLLLLFLP